MQIPNSNIEPEISIICAELPKDKAKHRANEEIEDIDRANGSGESSGGPEKGFKLLPVVILVLIFLAKDMCEIMISFGSKDDEVKNEIQ
jgi:hypothetical protein